MTIKRLNLALIVLVFVGSIAMAGQRTVAKVHTADVIEIEGGFTVRLTGVCAPQPGELLGDEAFRFSKEKLEGKRCVMSTWTTNNMASGIVHDSNGRAFASFEYIENGKWISINEELVKRGYAKVDTAYLPDYLEHLVDLQKEAKEAGLGIWKGNQ